MRLPRDLTGSSAPDGRRKKEGPCVDPEAAFAHRRGGGVGDKSELFFGYYGSLMTMVEDEHAAPIPELVRRVQLMSRRRDPVPGFTAVVTASVAGGVVVVHDVLADSGYAHRVPEHFAQPLRRAGASLVIDLHPADRGPTGKLRCPLRLASMALGYDRPEVRTARSRPAAAPSKASRSRRRRRRRRVGQSDRSLRARLVSRPPSRRTFQRG